MDAHIFITREIGEGGIRLFDIVSDVQAQPKATRYIIHFASNGGEVKESEMIADYLDRLQKTHQVVALGEGMVASAASRIFLTVSQRAATPKFEMMIHNPRGGVQGDAQKIEEYQKEVKHIEKDYEKFYSEKLNIDENTLSDLMATETVIDYERAKTLGIVNHELTQETPIIFSLNNIKQNNMNDQDKTWFQEQIKSLKTFFSPIKALTIKSNEGVELEFPGEVPAVGDKVTAPDGDYTFLFAEKKWKVTILNNAVTALTEITDAGNNDAAQVDALKKENETLKSEIAQLKTQLAEVEAMKKEVESLNKYVADHKAIMSKGEVKTEAGKNFNNAPVDPIRARLEAKRAELKKKQEQEFNV